MEKRRRTKLTNERIFGFQGREHLWTTTCWLELFSSISRNCSCERARTERLKNWFFRNQRVCNNSLPYWWLNRIHRKRCLVLFGAIRANGMFYVYLAYSSAFSRWKKIFLNFNRTPKKFCSDLCAENDYKLDRCHQKASDATTRAQTCERSDEHQTQRRHSEKIILIITAWLNLNTVVLVQQKRQSMSVADIVKYL